MADISWYDRFAEGFESTLEETCELMKELMKEGFMEIKYERLHKHPMVIVTVFDEEDPENPYRISICFDIYNQEIYIALQTRGPMDVDVRLMFHSTEDLFDYIHDMIHNFIEGEIEEAM